MREKINRPGFQEIVTDAACQLAEDRLIEMCRVFQGENRNLRAMAFALLEVSLDMARSAGYAQEVRFLEATRKITADEKADLLAKGFTVPQRYEDMVLKEDGPGAQH